ncbi:MAG: hypothetical protein ACRDJM_00280 [Actinomycetota bacterium]
MPERKKPSSRASARSTPRRASAASKKTTRRPASPLRRRPTRRPAPEELEPLELTAEGDAGESGPVVLGAPGVSGEGFGTADSGDIARTAPPTQTGDDAADDGGIVIEPAGEPEIPDRSPEDIPIMVVSAIMAGSVFLPWYRLKIGTGTTATATGWASGTWGPMIFFLGVLSLALAVLRRRGKRVNMPVPDSYVHEGAGWLSLIGAIIKLRLAPKSSLGVSMGWSPLMIPTIASAFILAFLAGRMSGSVPLVSLPGWFRGAAGRIGLALLALVIGGAVAFGTLNDVDVTALSQGRASGTGSNTGRGTSPDVIKNRFPKCAGTFPRPADAKPKDAVEQKPPNPCVFTYTSTRTPEQLLSFYKTELTKAGYTYAELPGSSTVGRALTFSKPTCGSMSMQTDATKKLTNVIVVLGGVCQSPGGRGGSGSGSGSTTGGGSFASPSPSKT